MLTGWRTYITIVVGAIFNVLLAMGYLVDLTQAEMDAFTKVLVVLIETGLLVAGVVFNFVGRKRIKQLGR